MASKKINIQPLNDRLILEPQVAEQQTSSGIFLPESAQEKPQYGTVVAVGPGVLNDDDERTPLSVKIGDKVVYARYGGTDITYNGVEYIMVRESDLLAKID